MVEPTTSTPGALGLAMAVLAVGATAALAGLAPPTAASHDRDRCERAERLLPWWSQPLKVRHGAVYEGLSRWYEHRAEDPGPTVYQVVPLVGDADLRVYDSDCRDEPTCSSQRPGPAVETCTVPGRGHVLEVRGVEAPQEGLGVSYVVQVSR